MYNQSKSLFHRTPNHRNLTSKSAHYTPQFIDEIYFTYTLDANLNANEHIQVARSEERRVGKECAMEC